MDKLRGCIGGQHDDSDHPIMEAQLAAQRGNSTGGEGEVRGGGGGGRRGAARLAEGPTNGGPSRLPPLASPQHIPCTIPHMLTPPAPAQVFILPTIRINGVQYRGKMATAEVLRAICAGFTAGNMPVACSKAMDDACMQGGKGAAECAARTDGKTQVRWGGCKGVEMGDGMRGWAGEPARPPARPPARWPQPTSRPCFPSTPPPTPHTRARSASTPSAATTAPAATATSRTLTPARAQRCVRGLGAHGAPARLGCWLRRPGAAAQASSQQPLPPTRAPCLHMQTCLDINECLSITQLDPKCTCERCACKNTRGGYE